MYLTDPIADMLTRIRNAVRVADETVDIPSSRVKLAIAQILKDEGFISKVESLTKWNKKIIRLSLRYGKKKKSLISEIKRISTPGRRIYVGKSKIPTIKAGFGSTIVSTSKGIMTGAQAKSEGVGGELLCHIW